MRRNIIYSVIHQSGDAAAAAAAAEVDGNDDDDDDDDDKDDDDDNDDDDDDDDDYVTLHELWTAHEHHEQSHPYRSRVLQHHVLCAIVKHILHLMTH